ncbi:MFS transporter [Alicyclobacillus herbarius]|uniref:MFS transporter n=1 Tax=Alicyclobacillus herbarius TaxID=122960 RepID=UPI000411FEEA|nr:MFS transporter [Alicyclobacillus herbarius]
MGKESGQSLLFTVNIYAFALNFQSSALLTIAVPALLIRLSPAQHTAALAQLATLSALVAMIIPPVVGFSADRGMLGGRHGSIRIGGALNALGLVGMYLAQDYTWFVVCCLVTMLGHSMATVAYQALWSEVVPPSLRGVASGYNGAAILLGTIFGLVTAAWSPKVSLLPMAGVICAGFLITTVCLPRSKSTPRSSVAQRLGRRGNFVRVFLAQTLISFGMTLLMTFVLYFFHDVLRISNPSQDTAFVAGLSLIGSVGASIFLGRFAHAGRRRRLTAVSILPMAVAAGGFAFLQSEQWILGFALLFGLGYGGFLATSWALTVDVLPDMEHAGRDLGIWGVASAIPTVLAPMVGGVILTTAATPASGYRNLFLLAAASFLAGAWVVWSIRAQAVSRAETNAVSQRLPSPWWGAPLRVFVSALVAGYVRLAYRVRFFDRIPKMSGPTLVISNHQHDLEGMVIPAWLTLRTGWRHPIHYVASQRLFEPGFLAFRGPNWLRPLLYRLNLHRLFPILGLVPIENQPLARPIHSYAYEARTLLGDVPLSQVFTDAWLARLNLPGHVRLSALWGRRWAERGQIRAPMTCLVPEVRKQLRVGQRARIERQLAEIRMVFESGRTLYLTPEGRYSQDGKMTRFRQSYNELAPWARALYAFALSYDPYLNRRLTLYIRIVSIPAHLRTDVDAVNALLAAARPVTVSQLICTWLSKLPSGTVFALEEACAGFRQVLCALPPGAQLVPEVADEGQLGPHLVPEAVEKTHLTEATARVLRGMIRQGSLERFGAGGFRLQTCHRHEKFPDVEDMIHFQATVLSETCEALVYIQEEHLGSHSVAATDGGVRVGTGARGTPANPEGTAAPGADSL